MSLHIVPVSMSEAKKFVGAKHRHNLAPKMAKFAVGVADETGLVGVGIAGRPVARALDDGVTLEVVRTCTNGAKNANSMIYGALARAAKALGYHRVVTYNLEEESGASLHAAGFVCEAHLPARGGWDTPSRPRYEVDLFGNQRTPTGPKRRWVRQLVAVEKERVSA